MKSWSLNQKLAASAFALGAVALFGHPYPGALARIDTRELALMVQQETDHVTAPELAGWIIEGRADYRLVDLRDEKAFAAYHIPGAERLPPTALLESDLRRNEKIVLYSDGGLHAVQSWMLLRARGFKAAYALRDGLDAWKDEVLYPALPANASAREQALYDKAVQVSAHFGGQPRGPAAAVSAPGAAPVRPAVQAAPPVAPPLAPAGAPAGGAPKKRRQGC